MTPDFEFYRAAKELIKQHGDDAPNGRGRGAGYPAPPRTDPGVRY